MLGIPRWIIVVGAALIVAFVWALLTGCQVPNPGWCGYQPGGCTDAGPPADAATDAPTDGSSLVAAITSCERRVPPPPDEGVSTDRPVVITCTAIARRCSAVVTPTTGTPPHAPFSVTFSPSGQGDEWVSESFLPALGENDIRVTCEGDQGTAAAVFPRPAESPLVLWAGTVTIPGAQCSAPGNCSLPARTTPYGLCWDFTGLAAGENCGARPTRVSDGVVDGNYGFNGGLNPCPKGCSPMLPISSAAPPGEVDYEVFGGPFSVTVRLRVPAP